MKKRFLTIVALLLMAAGVQEASAQRTADLTLTVTANNIGVFSCTIDGAASSSFDFGDVDASGTTSSTGVTGARNGADDGAEYEATAAAAWGCSAAPSSTVAIALTSVAADHTAGGMQDDGLEIRIPATGGGTSAGYQTFTSAANLITGMSVGNGANSVAGDVDLRLTVLDTDPTGANSWTVRLRATGSP